APVRFKERSCRQRETVRMVAVPHCYGAAGLFPYVFRTGRLKFFRYRPRYLYRFGLEDITLKVILLHRRISRELEFRIYTAGLGLDGDGDLRSQTKCPPPAEDEKANRRYDEQQSASETLKARYLEAVTFLLAARRGRF